MLVDFSGFYLFAWAEAGLNRKQFENGSLYLRLIDLSLDLLNYRPRICLVGQCSSLFNISKWTFLKMDTFSFCDFLVKKISAEVTSWNFPEAKLWWSRGFLDWWSIRISDTWGIFGWCIRRWTMNCWIFGS